MLPTWLVQRPVAAGRDEVGPLLLPSADRVLCRGSASRACESSASQEGLLQNYCLRGFADLGSHPCGKSYTPYACGSWDV